MKIVIVQWGSEGGAPVMGHHLKAALCGPVFEVELVDIADICLYDYLYSVAHNIPIYEARSRLVYEYFVSRNRPNIFIINCLKSAFAVSALKRLGAKIILYAHEGPSEMSNLALGNFFEYKDIFLADYLWCASRITINGVKFIKGPKPLSETTYLLEPFSKYTVDVRNDTLPTLINDNGGLNPPISNLENHPAIVIGACGTACKRKGFDRFVDLAKSMPDFNFIWAGSLAYVPVEFGVKYFNELQNVQNLILLGHLPDLEQFYCDLDFLIHLCREDPSPLTSWEAAGLGVRQIAFAEEIGNPHLISNSGHLLAGHYSAESLMLLFKNLRKTVASKRAYMMRSRIRLFEDFRLDTLRLIDIAGY